MIQKVKGSGFSALGMPKSSLALFLIEKIDGHKEILTESKKIVLSLIYSIFRIRKYSPLHWANKRAKNYSILHF